MQSPGVGAEPTRTQHSVTSQLSVTHRLTAHSLLADTVSYVMQATHYFDKTLNLRGLLVK